jgi:hypothetical protein
MAREHAGSRPSSFGGAGRASGYERHGILAEPDAIAQAEAQCLAGSAVRERRRLRGEERRVLPDERFIAELADAVRAQFSACPAERAERIGRHPRLRGSGRIGRTRAGRAHDADAVRRDRVRPAQRHELRRAAHVCRAARPCASRCGTTWTVSPRAGAGSRERRRRGRVWPPSDSARAQITHRDGADRSDQRFGYAGHPGSDPSLWAAADRVDRAS